jgi:hypothetical protein
MRARIFADITRIAGHGMDIVIAFSLSPARLTISRSALILDSWDISNR